MSIVLIIIVETMSNLQKNTKFRIAVAKPEHLDVILKLAQMYALSNFESPKLASKRGFLVSDFSRQTYEDFIQQNDFFWILEESGELKAFLLALDPSRKILDKALDAKIKKHGISKYILIKQICTHPEYTSKGVASYLYNAFIEKYGHIPLVTAIVTDPPNPRSVALHKKWGFVCAFKYKAPDGLHRSIWIRSKDILARHYTKEILERQYPIAVDLYKHEDDLNWKKLYNLFYVTGALLFILSYISGSIETFPNDVEPSMLGILGATGVLISISFAMTIRSGVTYLQARKGKVIEIEQKLKVFGGILAVGDVSASPKLRVSPTTVILKFLPLVFALGWSLLLCYSVVKLLHLLP